MKIVFGKWTEDKLDHIIRQASELSSLGARIEFLSAQFLGTQYKEDTLIGGKDIKEEFVINLEWVDCFTFIDYIEAMRLSKSFSEFKSNLMKVRYRSGNISYESRNHFFADWREFNSGLVEDVTEKIGADGIRRIKKMLNRRDDGTYFLPGIPCREREVVYIPSESVDDAVIERLKTGDYAGIYSEKEGLDVSHVGIIIKGADKTLLRHASSSAKNRKVVDEDFREYIIDDKPGIVLLRPN
ncbi:MAG: N-acetylmuramoyl-L-alanine amidase-like domain-containing protein [Nitrospirota bacterium]